MNSETIKKKLGIKKIGLIILVVILVILLAGGAFVYSVISSGKPQINGEIKIDGLKEPATILRDENGVAHITANSLEDVYFAQGYAQAQDRLFQMDLSRRLASGRLSELFGEMAVEQDKYYLTLGLKRASELSIPEYSPETLELLKSFTNGINAYMQQAINKTGLPVEFGLLGYEPEPWTELDTLTQGKLMAHDLGGNWQAQVFRQYILETLPEEQAKELLPPYDYFELSSINDVDLLKDLAATGVEPPDENNGSNNWVVSGSKTASGMPLLADDPHLSMATPSIWYVNHLKAPGMEVSGATFGGVPGIILGQNNDCAWGVTNTGPDVQDLYIEKINSANENQYEYKGEWLDMKLIPYEMKVKDAESITYMVRETVHGPIMSDFAGSQGKEKVLALRWTALEATLELEALLEYNRATNWQEFEKALEKFQAPTQNFVFASTDGTIAYKANGRIPIRKGDGLLPVEGWTGENEWEGFVPFDELPRVVNPESGYVVTANYKVVTDSYPYHITHDWALPYRHARIDEVIKGANSLTPEDMRLLQDDTKNLRAQEILPVIIPVLEKLAPTDERLEKVCEIFKQWQASGMLDEPEDVAPLIFAKMMDELPRELFSGEIDAEMLKFFGGMSNTTDKLIKEHSEGEKSIWIDNYGGLDKLVQNTLNKVLDEIEQTQGKDIAKWSYGNFHQVMFKHPMSVSWYLEALFNPKGKMPTSGSKVTVRAAGYSSDGTNNHGSTWRFVADLQNLSSAQQIVAPGNSGHPLSPYYQDQIDRWINGELYTVSLNETKGQTLLLVPN